MARTATGLTTQPHMTTYPDSVRYLYSLGNEVRTIKLGLDRIEALLGELGNPHHAFRSVHIAGTNGKGFVSAMIASGLRAAGIRTGLYTSPHLMEPTERIQVDGEPVGTEQFVRAFDMVHQTAERMYRHHELETHPTYFETVTAMGFVLFRELGVKRAVVETGLGGRLDATNSLRPELCVITRIDYDHEAYLGNSLEAIAGEKAGILKPATPAVFAAQRPEAFEVLVARAAALGVRVHNAADWTVLNSDVGADGSRFTTTLDGPHYSVECPLAGAHQIENSLAALPALLELGVEPRQALRGIAETRWPGRLETVSRSPHIVLDGAHNPGGIRALANYIREFYRDRRIWIIYGSMRDKSLDEIAGVLSPLASHVIVTNPGSHRALRAEVLHRIFEHSSVQIASSVKEALSLASAAAPDDAVFVTGSLILVGEARRLLVR